ncbi:hypothetical protein [Reinekea sp.]|uniref:hypothetical protein n=1 Tax=Reinekea sp. TaxID=1970455 RepID=UPI002A816ABB|nr:hypothetical protein [Reinekea sp.]
MCRLAHYLFATLLVVPLIATANPMRPDTERAKASSVPSKTIRAAVRLPRLTAIVVIGDLRRAIFSGDREQQVGDRIDGFTLVAINSTRVLLKRGGQTTQLTLQSTGEMLIAPAQED